MTLPNLLTAEVVFAVQPNHYKMITVRVPQGTTLEQAILASGILNFFPAINLHGQGAQNLVGIWGTLKDLTTPVQEGDRIEIYRPLPVSAQEARFKRVKKSRHRG